MIDDLYWATEQEDHIARHGVTPQEVEEVVFDDPRRLFVRVGPADRNPNETIYRCLGRTVHGRYLLVALLYLGNGGAVPLTARAMSAAERRRYSR